MKSDDINNFAFEEKKNGFPGCQPIGLNEKSIK